MIMLLYKAMVFLQNEEGAASVEYALLVGLIALVIAGAVGLFGTTLAGSYMDSKEKLFPG